MKKIYYIVLLSSSFASLQYSRNIHIECDIQVEEQDVSMESDFQNIIEQDVVEFDHEAREQAVETIEAILHAILDPENTTSLLQHLDDVHNAKQYFHPVKDKKAITAVDHFIENKDELIHTPNNFMLSFKNIKKPIRLYKAYCQLPGKKPKYESTKKVIAILFAKCDQASQELKALQANSDASDMQTIA